MSVELGYDKFLTCDEGRRLYNLSEAPSSNAPDLHGTIHAEGIARIGMNVGTTSFEDLIDLFEESIAEHLVYLGQTFHDVDKRYGNQAGYQRRERVIDPETGLQTLDAKHFFHFNERANQRWRASSSVAPLAVKGFLAAGYDIQSDLVRLAKEQYQALEATHPNIMSAYFPKEAGALGGFSFMRVLSYDGYDTSEVSGPVAKPHYDIASSTIQAYSDAPGFWGTTDRIDGVKIYHDQTDGYGHFFVGKGHKKVFGEQAVLQPLWHGVDRIVSETTSRVPSRHAVILFINAPFIDYAHKKEDLVPYIADGKDL